MHGRCHLCARYASVELSNAIDVCTGLPLKFFGTLTDFVCKCLKANASEITILAIFVSVSEVSDASCYRVSEP